MQYSDIALWQILPSCMNALILFYICMNDMDNIKIAMHVYIVLPSACPPACSLSS